MKTRSVASAGEETPNRGPGIPGGKFMPLAAVCALSIGLAACGGGSGADIGASVEETPPATTNPGLVEYNLGNTPQEVIDQCMAEEDKRMLTQVNNARAAARDCGTERYAEAPALSWHCTLADVAFMHDLDMAENNFFSHTGSDGLSAGDRVTNAGYDWSTVGENIAAGYETVEIVMEGWLASPGHCANIMQARYTEFGSAVYEEPDSDYRFYWTQVFATPAG